MRNEKTFKALIEINLRDNASKAIESFNGRFSNLKILDNHFNFTDRKLLSTTKLFEKYGNKFKDFGGALTKGITAPLAAGAAYGLKIAGDFEKEMLKAKAATDGVMFGELRAKALSEAIRTQYSPREVAEGIKTMGKGGVKPIDLIKSLPATLDLASAADEDVGYTAGVLAGVQNVFQRSSNQIRETVDKLTTAFTGSKLTLHDVIESLDYSAAIASHTGQSLESTLFGISALGAVNYKGSTAGTGISSIFEELSRLEPRARKAFDRKGILPKDIFKDFEKGIAHPLLEIVKLLKSKNLYTRDLLDMFGVQGSRAMGDLMKLSNQQLDNIQYRITNQYDGKAEKFSKANTDGALNKLGIFKSSIEVLQTKLWDDTGILAQLTGIIDKANGKLAAINEGMDGKKESIKAWMKFAGIISIVGPVIAGLGIFISFITKFMQYFFGLKGILSVLKFLAVSLLPISLKFVGLVTLISSVVSGMIWMWQNWSSVLEKIESFKAQVHDTWIGKTYQRLSDWYEHPKSTHQIPDMSQALIWRASTPEKKQIEVTFKNLPETATVKETGFLKGLSLNLGYKWDHPL